MMIPSNYEINVSRHQRFLSAAQRVVHYCKIELGQLLPADAEQKFDELLERFPADEGFSLTLCRVECTGYAVRHRDAIPGDSSPGDSSQ